MTLNDSTRRNSSINARPVKSFFDAGGKPRRSVECHRAERAARHPETFPRIEIVRTYTPRPVMTFPNQSTDDRNETHRSLRSDSHSSVHTRVSASSVCTYTYTSVHTKSYVSLRSVAFNGERGGHGRLARVKGHARLHPTCTRTPVGQCTSAERSGNF
jgi:hypothetical protein